MKRPLSERNIMNAKFQKIKSKIVEHSDMICTIVSVTVGILAVEYAYKKGEAKGRTFHKDAHDFAHWLEAHLKDGTPKRIQLEEGGMFRIFPADVEVLKDVIAD
jgi:hypothetical protein